MLAHEPVTLGRLVPLKHDRKGNPIIVALPRRVELMEAVAAEFFDALSSVSVTSLKHLQPSTPFVPLVESLINLRLLMGGEGSE